MKAREIMCFLSEDYWRNIVWRIWLFITGRHIVVAGFCRGCGACCRAINLEAEGGWLTDEDTFARIIANDESLSQFKLMAKSGGVLVFSCSALGSDNRCMDYEMRPHLCKKYPDPSLFWENGYLHDGCGYYFKQESKASKVSKCL